MEPENAAEIAAFVGLDVLQLHGSEDARYIGKLRRLLKPGTEIWKAVKIGGGSWNTACGDLHLNGELLSELEGDSPEHKDEWLESYRADRLILDTYIADRSGGTGQTFDWRLAQQLRRQTQLPFVLAGGLHPGNVRQAIEQVSPYAVDVSSGVEGDGIKDEAKVRNFIEAVRGESR